MSYKRKLNYATSHEVSFLEEDVWRVSSRFHLLSFRKKKMVLANMILWAEKMDAKIDQEYEKNNHLEKL